MKCSSHHFMNFQSCPYPYQVEELEQVINGENDLVQLNANCKLIKSKIRIRFALLNHLETMKGTPELEFSEDLMGDEAISMGDDDKEKAWAVWIHLYPNLEAHIVDKWATTCIKIAVKANLPSQLFTMACTYIDNANQQKVCFNSCCLIIHHAHQCSFTH
jgi:hypothetical protein